jgi:hypothetical protein
MREVYYKIYVPETKMFYSTESIARPWVARGGKLYRNVRIAKEVLRHIRDGRRLRGHPAIPSAVLLKFVVTPVEEDDE